MTGVTTALADVSAALLGEFIDAEGLSAIAKMHPDASGAHAPGMLVIAGGRKKRRLTKRDSHAALREGYLQQGRRLAGTAPPAQPHGDSRKRAVTAGLSAVGAGAGVGGLAYGAHDMRTAVREGRKIPLKTKALVPLEIAGLGGEVMATRILHGDAKKAKLQKFEPKDAPGDIVWGGTFSKFDDSKRLAFGWASVVELNGQPVIDRQGDVISVDEIENAGYEYMLNSRIGGRMHERTADDKPVHASDVVESVIFTPEKCTAMGISKELSGRWWLGVKVRGDDDWDSVRKGELTGFSIHGKGLRKSTTVEELLAGLST